MTYMSELRRSTSDRMIGGVSGGLAHVLRVDSNLLRMVWVLLFLLDGIGGMLYAILWRVLPDDANPYSSFL